MLIYFLLILGICFTWCVASTHKEWDNILFKTTFGLCLLVEGLRASTVGVDTQHYTAIFKSIGEREWSYVFQIGNVEWGYALYNKIVYTFFPFSQAIIFFNSFIVLMLFFLFIKKESIDKWMSIYFFVTLLYYINTFNTVRQYIAVAIVLVNFDLIKKKKLIKYIVVVLVASTFHTSMLIMIPFYFFSNIKITKKKIALLCIISYILANNFEWIRSFLMQHLDFRRQYLIHLQSNQQTGNGRTFLVALAITIFGIYFYKEVKKKYEDQMIIYYYIAFSSCFFYLLATKFYLMVRVAETFAVCFVIFIPKVIYAIQDKKTRNVVGITVLFMCFLHFTLALTLGLDQGTIPYSFCF